MLLALGASCAKRFAVQGMVLRVDRDRQTVLVSHQQIPGYMQAMAMPFRVRQPAELNAVTPGARVRFQLVVKKSGSFIRRLHYGEAVVAGIGQPSGIRLPEPSGKVTLGSMMPDFSLTDQSGRPVRLSDFRGKVVAVNFIYTRCPLPDVCPRLSGNFARVQRRFGARLGKDLELLSISIDPQYDTPEVLSRYARIWGANPAGWRFLTGELPDVQTIAGRFGLVYWPEEGLLTHTSAAGIVGRDGKLAAVVEGSTYSATQLGDLIAVQLEMR